MSIALKDSITVTRLLLIQSIAFFLVSILLLIKQSDWFIPAFCGGLVAVLPNVVFTLFSLFVSTKIFDSSSGYWLFTLGWLVKIVLTIVLAVIAINVFIGYFIPLGIGFLSVVMMQFLAPVILSIF